MTESKTCSRCILNEDVPGVRVDASRLCSVCRNHDTEWGDWDKTKAQRRAELLAIFKRIKRKKAPYDVLVPLSGGKDSVYILYQCRKVFGLNCLAVTFDNGFLSDHARENIAEACRRLAVDHVYYQIDRDRLMRLYRACFLKTGFLCPVCLQSIGVGIMRTQRGFDIPLRVDGTSRRTEEYVSPEFFVSSDPSFLENVFSGSEFEEDLRVIMMPVGIVRTPPSIRLPDYMDWTYSEIFRTITKELGWKASTADAEHTDCVIDNIVSFIRYKRFPVLVPEFLRFSKLVTVGQMTREEARGRVEQIRESLREPENLGWFLREIGISRDEFEKAFEKPTAHVKYLRRNSRYMRRLRAIWKGVRR